LGAEEVAAIARICVAHDLVVITDEIYSELTYSGTPHASIAAEPGMKERTIFLHGFSKAFAMTGFRIGYACAPPDLLEAMLRVHQYAMMCAPIVSQDAALEALTHGAEDLVRMREQYRLRRNFIVKTFNEIGLKCHLPEGAFYAFPSIQNSGLNAREFSVRLLEQERVALVPGTAFGPGGEGFVRASYCAPMEELEQAAERIARFVKAL
jgi:aminotransferase